MRELLATMMAAGILVSLACADDQTAPKQLPAKETFEALKAEYDAAIKKWSDDRDKELDAAKKAALKDEIFGKHLETVELNCNRGDQLTSELKHFIYCVKTQCRPRVTGEDGRNALALAERILESVRQHRWNGQKDDQAVGVEGFPAPLGSLFNAARQEAA